MVGYNESKEKQLNSFAIGLAGAFSGIVTRSVGQPFDVLKIRFQLQVEPINKHSSTSKYRANLQALQRIFHEEGFTALWKGHIPGQLLSISYGIIQTFELLTYNIRSNFPSVPAKSPHLNFWCGCAAGTLGTICSFPFDVIRTRFVAQGTTKVYTSMMNAVGVMIATEGSYSLFKGLSPTLLLVAPQAGAMFMFHKFFSDILRKFRFFSSDAGLNISGNLVVGSLAGIFGKSVVYPLDLARKRLQIQGFKGGRQGFGENFTCTGLFNCLYKSVKKERIIGLYKGLSPSIVKAGITTALHFTVYEESCRMMERLNVFHM